MGDRQRGCRRPTSVRPTLSMQRSGIARCGPLWALPAGRLWREIGRRSLAAGTCSISAGAVTAGSCLYPKASFRGTGKSRPSAKLPRPPRRRLAQDPDRNEQLRTPCCAPGRRRPDGRAGATAPDRGLALRGLARAPPRRRRPARGRAGLGFGWPSRRRWTTARRS
jgi:hypothetical protein